MAVEQKRGCGYRRAGGLYLVSKGLGLPCDRLPAALVACTQCGTEIKQVRSWQWVNVAHALVGAKSCTRRPGGDAAPVGTCATCPVCNPADNVPGGKVGLLWVGTQHYPTPADWAKEANQMGVSKRIPAIPDGLKLGETWVFVAHPRAFAEPCACTKPDPDAAALPSVMQPDKGGAPVQDCTVCGGEGKLYKPGITHAFRPSAVELVATPSMAKARWAKRLVKEHGVQIVEVPEGDPDHAPKVRKAAPRARAMAKAARAAQPAGGEEE